MAVEIKGLKELEAKLVKMEGTVALKTLRKSMMSATLPTLTVMKALAPQDTKRGAAGSKSRRSKHPGGLIRTIKRKFIPEKYGHAASIEIGPRGKRSFYAKWVEFGTKPHSTSKNVLSKGTGKLHPGAKPNPFIRRAWKKTTRTVLKQFRIKFKKDLDMVMK